MLAAAVRDAGAIAYRVGIVSDDPAEFADALSDQLVRADVVVTSGGVSKGEYDVVKEVLAELGTVWFGEVRMQPGKPQGFGHVGEDGTPIFALPGNPVSSYVSFELFVLPALRRMMGRRRTAVRRPSPSSATVPLASREGAVRPRASTGTTARWPRVARSAATARTCSATWPTANALIVVPEEVEAWRPASRWTCCCWTGTSEDGTRMAEQGRGTRRPTARG